MNLQDNNSEICDTIQVAISEAIDSNHKFSEEIQAHLKYCPECLAFVQMWQPESTLSKLASGSLTHSENISKPVLSILSASRVQRERTQKASMFRVATIAATFMCALALLLSNHDSDDINTSQIAVYPEQTTTPITDESNIKLTPVMITLTQEKIEHSFEKNYLELSAVASESWQSATNSISNITELLSNGTEYLSTKLLSPPNDQSMNIKLHQNFSNDQPAVASLHRCV